jgi:hypothetical protein
MLIASGIDRPAIAGIIFLVLVGVLLWAEAKMGELRSKPETVPPTTTLESEESDGV